MISRDQYIEAANRAIEMFRSAGILLTPEEQTRIEVADFGLGRLEETGLQLFTYVSTNRCCAKELAIFPGQTCPEHRHPPFENDPGKEETFRCRWGQVHLFVEGVRTDNPKAQPPEGVYTVFHERILLAGEQYTVPPNTLHWFQGGPHGAVVSEFSTQNSDQHDIFSDPRLTRAPEVGS